MKAAAQRSRPTLLTPVDEFPEVQCSQRKRDELAQRLDTSRAEHTRLLSERDRVRAERHTAAVAAIGVGKDPELHVFDGQLLELESHIVRAVDLVAQIGDALAQHEVLLESTRATVAAELREQVALAGRQVVGAMLPLLRQLQARNQELERLHGVASRLGGVQLPFLLPLAMVAAWVDQAGRYEAEPTAERGV